VRSEIFPVGYFLDSRNAESGPDMYMYVELQLAKLIDSPEEHVGPLDPGERHLRRPFAFYS
jgi:hypothetical protein